MTDTALTVAQRDLAQAYAGGGPGVLVSGLVWLIAGAVWQLHGVNAAFAALFFGGMAIHPLGVLIERLAFRAPKATVGKPLETLAIEATIPLFVGVMIAWVLLVRAPDLAIPVFAAIVGARYFLFRTMYGEIAYWVVGGAILAVAGITMFGISVPLNLGYVVGIVELAAAAIILQRWRTRR
ncbi:MULTISPECIES: DUF7010 family protein [unclassified Sphingopyxis]|uniref:DUF7010 family protein n=1 Tax=unclassified Sphingopyxis TaxID=2614943 RepID=UPI002861CB68|nr:MULTISPECIES: hypothetical protein [unclassified Sphingopyxis]MDR6833798.1 hypothetical protein [Sphingopyxis sp. BE122]MDR7226067.1 hypothetical protein [Sphingopyxis sp. BE259]